MNNSKYYITIVLILLIILFLNLVSPIIGEEITTILTTVTTITGIFSVFIEMKRSADIAECEFIFNLQKQFDDNETIQEVYKCLDNAYFEKKNIDGSIDRQKIVTYLTFFEMMCNLIIKGVLKIDDVDALYAYPFFIATNNKDIQTKELATYKQFYRNIYTVYSKWYNYRKKRGYEIPYEENRLIKK